MKPKKFNQDSLLKDALARIETRKQAHKRQREECVPPGWFSADQIGAARGKSRLTITRLMKSLGVPSKTFNRWCGPNIRPIIFYNP